jgi:hypothetical protein
MSRQTRPALSGLAIVLLLLLAVCGCSGQRGALISPSFTIPQNQAMVPVQPFNAILVPVSFTETVFDDFVDTLNDNRAQSGFALFGIIKENLSEVETILTPAHVYLSGEIWSYLEDSGCCATELKVKSRLRIQRVRSREILWEKELPLESFFEHDASTLAVEREKLARRLARELAAEALKALKGARRIQLD